MMHNLLSSNNFLFLLTARRYFSLGHSLSTHQLPKWFSRLVLLLQEKKLKLSLLEQPLVIAPSACTELAQLRLMYVTALRMSICSLRHSLHQSPCINHETPPLPP
jgi:hypothetical protein